MKRYLLLADNEDDSWQVIDTVTCKRSTWGCRSIPSIPSVTVPIVTTDDYLRLWESEIVGGVFSLSEYDTGKELGEAIIELLVIQELKK